MVLIPTNSLSVQSVAVYLYALKFLTSASYSYANILFVFPQMLTILIIAVSDDKEGLAVDPFVEKLEIPRSILITHLLYTLVELTATVLAD